MAYCHKLGVFNVRVWGGLISGEGMNPFAFPVDASASQGPGFETSLRTPRDQGPATLRNDAWQLLRPEDATFGSTSVEFRSGFRVYVSYSLNSCKEII